MSRLLTSAGAQVRMLGGRTFTVGEDAPGGSPVVVLSYGFWQRWFAGDRDVVGRELTVDGIGIRRTIIGILSSDFAFAPVGDAELCVGVALVASYVPARRATRVDPAMVLRSE